MLGLHCGPNSQGDGTRLFQKGSLPVWRVEMSIYRPSMLIVVLLFTLAVPLSVLTRPGVLAAAASCHPLVPDDNRQAHQMLSQLRPFAPRNRAIFYSYELPDWKD